MGKRRLNIIGNSIPIREAHNKARGRTQFIDDMKAELHIKFLGSPHPHAIIKKIDISYAKKMKGVEAILTYKEVPQKYLGFSTHRSSFVMEKQLRYVGDYVAAVAATSVSAAEEALGMIKVEYEQLPAVFDPEEAANSTAPKIYTEGNVYGPSGELFLKEGINEPSLEEWGDIENGLKEADVVVEDTFDVMPQIHSPIEPHVCMAQWEGEELTIWCSTQTPWELRFVAADFFDIPESRVTVLSPNVGGGFGGKYTGRYQVIPCLLSKMAGGKLSKLTFTREEEQCYSRRPRVKILARIGAKKDGTITAIYFKGYFDIGAYGNIFTGSLGFHLEGGILSYKSPNARFEGWDVHTNHFRSECCRSVQVPFLAFAIESIVDQVAEMLNIDPIEFRLKNMPETGDMMPPTPYVHNTMEYPRARLDIYPGETVLRRVMEKIGWEEKWKGFGKASSIEGSKRKGVGIAYCQGYCGLIEDGSRSMSTVIYQDGSVTVYSGAQELGQGINTALCILVAESLDIDIKDVAIITGNTNTGQYDFINARSSSQLTTSGLLLLKAIEKAKEKIREISSDLLEASPEDLVISNKRVYVKGSPKRSKPLREIIAGTITGTATGPRRSIYPAVKPGYKDRQPMVMAVEIEVDIETGNVKPIKLVAGMFPGQIVNREVVRGQTLGGAAMALGMALWEEFRYNHDSSFYYCKDFTDYKVPRALDIPRMETVFIEEVDEKSPAHEGLPFGGRGIGEMSAWGGPAVIANAIYNATNVRIKKSPMTPESVLKALRKEGARR